MFSNICHDLDVYGGDWSSQGFWAMLVYRFGRWRYGFKMAVIRKPLSLVYKLLYKMVQIAAGTDVPVVHTVELLDWATGGPVPEALAGLAAKSMVRDNRVRETIEA